jgi:sec-independent protein translocase protein TatA
MGYKQGSGFGTEKPRPNEEKEMNIPLIGLPLIGIGMTEWIIIGAAILLFFGATKLPKLGKGLGEGIRNFKKGIKGELDENGKAIEPTPEPPAETPPSEEKPTTDA